MKINKIYVFIIYLGSCALNLKAQDPYYSQAFMSPMSLNPALIGKGVSDIRFLSNMRTQTWGTSGVAFKTTSASFESRIAEKKFPDDHFGIGVSFINDASNGGLLNRNFITVGAAFNKKLTKYSRLGVGLSGTYANMLLDQSKFTFQSQFGSMGFIRSLPTYEPLLVTNRTYFNADGGIHYSYEDSVWGFNFGFAIFHAAKNRQGAFQNSNFTFLPRYSSRSSVVRKFKGGDEINFIAGLDLQGVNNIYTLGTLYKYNIPGEGHPITKLNLGFFSRIGDSYYPYFGIESKSFMAGITYDIMYTDVRRYYNSVQSFELSIGWLINKKKSNNYDKSHIRSVTY